MTKEDHEKSCQDSCNHIENSKTNDYERGYQNAILEFQKQYNLRNRNVNVEKLQVDQPSNSEMKKDPPRKVMQKKDEQKIEIMSKKVQEDKKESSHKEIDKSQSLFSLENEKYKIKILVSFNENLKNTE